MMGQGLGPILHNNGSQNLIKKRREALKGMIWQKNEYNQNIMNHKCMCLICKNFIN